MRRNSFTMGSSLAAAFTPLSMGTAHVEPGSHRGKARIHMKTRDGFGILPPQFRQLNLNQRQRNEIRKIKSETLPVLHHFYRQMRQVRTVLKAASTDSKHDAEKVRKLAIKLGQLQTEIARRRSDDRYRIYAALDPRQQNQIKHMHEWCLW